MGFSVIIGSAGVFLLLLAFFLNLFRIIKVESRVYIILNIAGAGMSCYASVLIGFVPFIVLEAVWCAVAVAGLIRTFYGKEI